MGHLSLGLVLSPLPTSTSSLYTHYLSRSNCTWECVTNAKHHLFWWSTIIFIYYFTTFAHSSNTTHTATDMKLQWRMARMSTATINHIEMRNANVRAIWCMKQVSSDGTSSVFNCIRFVGEKKKSNHNRLKITWIHWNATQLEAKAFQLSLVQLIKWQMPNDQLIIQQLI